MKPFSLYDEDKRTVTGDKTVFINPYPEQVESMLEIDISEPQTLFSMSSKVREVLMNKPDDYELPIYLVCGNVCSKDAGLFADYLKDVTQPILIAFRGIVHFDFIHLFLENEVHINSQSKVMYSRAKLHDTMKNFLLSPKSFKMFMQRFVDEYWKFSEGTLLPISELELLGIETKTL